MDNNILNFLSSIVKPRDFIISAIISLPIFVMESFDDSIIPFLSAGESSIAGVIIGLTISKVNDMTIIKHLDKNKPLKRFKTLIKRINKEIAKPDLSEERKKTFVSLKEDSETTIEYYHDKFIDEIELNDRFKKLIHRYEMLLIS